MQEEEKRLDKLDPSDAELQIWEAKLEQSIRRELGKQSSQDSDPDALQRNWEKIQESMSASQIVPLTEDKASQPLSFRRKNKFLLLPWLGGIAAAALLLILVKPKPEDRTLPMDSAGTNFKGTAVSGMQADCELDASAVDGSLIEPIPDGTGFQGPSGAMFGLSLRCSHDGFLQVQVDGSNSSFIRNIPVKAGLRLEILRDGQPAHFLLQTQKTWNFRLLLSQSAFLDNQSLPPDGIEPKGDQVLWMDTILVRGKE